MVEKRGADAFLHGASLDWTAASVPRPAPRRRSGSRSPGRAEQRDADCPAHFPDRVVQRRGHLLLLPRQRGGDRCGRWRHRERHAEADDHQARQRRQGSHRRARSPASSARPAPNIPSRSSSVRACAERAFTAATPTTAPSSRSPSAAGRPRRGPPSTRARPAGTGHTRKKPNITPNATSRLTEPDASPWSRNRRTSNSGASWRRSQATNRRARRHRRRARRRVSGAPQPCSGPSWIPSTTAPIASAERTEPPMSKRPSCAHGFGDIGDRHDERTTARTIGRTNIQRQVKMST